MLHAEWSDAMAVAAETNAISNCALVLPDVRLKLSRHGTYTKRSHTACRVFHGGGDLKVGWKRSQIAAAEGGCETEPVILGD